MNDESLSLSLLAYPRHLTKKTHTGNLNKLVRTLGHPYYRLSPCPTRTRRVKRILLAAAPGRQQQQAHHQQQQEGSPSRAPALLQHQQQAAQRLWQQPKQEQPEDRSKALELAGPHYAGSWTNLRAAASTKQAPSELRPQPRPCPRGRLLLLGGTHDHVGGLRWSMSASHSREISLRRTFARHSKILPVRRAITLLPALHNHPGAKHMRHVGIVMLRA